MPTKNELIKLLLLFFIWRMALFSVSFVAPSLLPYDPSFPYSQELAENYGLPFWLYSWGNFDGVHYLTIIEKGYLGTGLIQAFFPLYPAVSWLLSFIINNNFLSAFMVSNFFALLVLVLFYFLLKIEHFKFKWQAIISLLLFPSSFFLVAIYNESLFISLVLAFFIALKNKKWLWAGFFAGLASATRLVGVFLFFSLLYVLWKHRREFSQKKEKIIALTSLLLSVFGLAIYMMYLGFTFGDPLYFSTVQSQFGAGRQSQIILLPQVIWRYIKILATVNPVDLKYYSYFQDLFLSLSTLLGLFIDRKKIKFEYAIFSLGAFLLPTLTGTFSSMPRYILPIFPIYFVLATLWQKKPVVFLLCMTISAFFLILNTVLFIQGYWVA